MNVYTIEHRRLCKVCKTGLAVYFDCLYFYRRKSYNEIIESNPEYCLNKVNLHNHFTASSKVQEFWGSLTLRFKGEDIKNEQVLNEVRAFYGMPLIKEHIRICT